MSCVPQASRALTSQALVFIGLALAAIDSCGTKANGGDDDDSDSQNQPPVAVSDSTSVTAGASAIIAVLDNDSDPDGDALSVVSITSPGVGTATHDARTVTYTAPTDYTGGVVITYTVSDGTAQATADINIAVTGTAMTIVANTGFVVTRGQSFTFTPQVLSVQPGSTATLSDPVYTMVSTPQVGALLMGGARLGSGGTFTQSDIARAALIYQSDASATQPYDSFAFSATDGISTVRGSVAITITPVQVTQPPHFDALQSLTVARGGSSCLNPGKLHAVDTAGSTDGVSIRLEAVPTSGTLKLAGTTLGLGGTFTNDDIAGGQICYENAPSSSATTDTLGLAAGKDGKWSTTSTLTVQIVDDAAPVIETLTAFVVSEGTTRDFASYYLRANDTDTAATSLVFTLARVPAHGTLVLLGSTLAVGDTFTQDDIDLHRLAYINDGLSYATDSFELDLTDGVTVITDQTFAITIQAVNDPASAVGQALDVDENTHVDFVLDGTDEDGDTLTVEIPVKLPGHGTLTVLPAGTPITATGWSGTAPVTLRYTPAAHYVGTDDFSFRVKDPTGPWTDLRTVTFTAHKVNSTPVGNPDTVTARYKQTATFAVLANDSDPDGDTLTITGVSAPAHGDATVVGNSIQYIPTDGTPFSATTKSYTDTLTYDIADGQGGTVTGITVTITVETRIIYVDGSAPGPTHDGASWATAFLTPQEAVAQVATTDRYDQIWIADGIYKPAAANASVLSFTSLRDLSIYGGFVGTESALTDRPTPLADTVLSGDFDGTPAHAAKHVVYAWLAERVVLDGLEVTRGHAAGATSDERMGGGMYLRVKGLTLSQLFVHDNRADYVGGGLLLDALQDAPVSISDCDFVSNRAQVNAGGAMLSGGVTSSTLTLQRSSFTDNEAVDGDGGAVTLSFFTSLEIRDCGFLRNSGSMGGAISVETDTLIVNSALADNSATSSYGRGGAVSIRGTHTATLVHCTLVRNVSSYGGAVGIETTGQAVVENSVLWGNSDPAGRPIAATDTALYRVSHSCISGAFTDPDGSSDNVTLDPIRGNPVIETASGQYFLDQSAADYCIGAGSGTIATDYLGNWRALTTAENGAPEINNVDAGCHYAAGPVIHALGMSWPLASGTDYTWLSFTIANCQASSCSCSIAPRIGAISLSQSAASIDPAVAGERFTLTCQEAGGVRRHARARIGDVLYVNGTGGNDANDGQSWGTAKSTIQSAMDAAVAGDAVWVATGTYTAAVDTPVVTMHNGVSVYGGFAGTEVWLNDRGAAVDNPVMLDGQGHNASVVVAASSAYLERLTIKNGKGGLDWGGGGIVAKAATGLSMDSIWVTNNSSTHMGGGIALNASAATLKRVEVYGNRADMCGGGVWVGGAAPVTIERSSIHDNGSTSTTCGGGVALAYAAARLYRTIITSNVVSNTSGYGAGANIEGSAAYLDSVRFYSNSAASGAALNQQNHGLGGTDTYGLIVVNSLFANNGNGAIKNSDYPELVNVTISGTTGGSALASSGGLAITNAVVWGNSAITFTGTFLANSCYACGGSCQYGSYDPTSDLAGASPFNTWDADGDGLNEYFLATITNGSSPYYLKAVCQDIGSNSAAANVGFTAWSTMGTQFGTTDTGTIDPGMHY